MDSVLATLRKKIEEYFPKSAHQDTKEVNTIEESDPTEDRHIDPLVIKIAGGMVVFLVLIVGGVIFLFNPDKNESSHQSIGAVDPLVALLAASNDTPASELSAEEIIEELEEGEQLAEQGAEEKAKQEAEKKELDAKKDDMMALLLEEDHNELIKRGDEEKQRESEESRALQADELDVTEQSNTTSIDEKQVNDFDTLDTVDTVGSPELTPTSIPKKTPETEETQKIVSLPVRVQMPEGKELKGEYILVSNGGGVLTYPQEKMDVIAPLDIVILLRKGSTTPFLSTPVFENQEQILLTADTTAVATLYTGTSLLTLDASLEEKRKILTVALGTPKFADLIVLVQNMVSSPSPTEEQYEDIKSLAQTIIESL